MDYEETIGSPLLIIGGAEDKYNERLILRKFLELAGKKKASILIIPVASDFPEMAASTYSKIFRSLGAKKIADIQPASRKEAMDIDAEAALGNVTGVFISGGDQMRLSTILGGTPFAHLLKKRIREDGIVLAGSSAGAAGLSASMIVRGKSTLHPQKDSIRLSPGLGILNEIIIDQHFSERTRLNRLITAVCYNPHNLGIGIDENTATVISRDGVMEVIGSGTVTIVDGSEISFTNMAEVSPEEPFSVFGLKIHILTNGSKYNVFRRQPIHNGYDLPSTDTEKEK